MQGRNLFRYAVELLQSPFGERPKSLDSGNVRRAVDEFICRMIDPEMFLKADINQPVIAAPLVRVNNGLQRFLGAVRDNLGINLAVYLEDAEDFGLVAGSATALAFHSTRIEVGSVNLDFAQGNRRRSFRFFGSSFSDFQENSVDCHMCHRHEFSRFTGGQIEREITDNLPFRSETLAHR